ncbi:MAG: serine/threonine protein kinase/tetratricopeptide (TPR) repeat protein [Planctomycetota bacterium]|jgi:serine/threonine protein kinase/tetratricopeptide (TPR) repeat protein
MNDINAIHPDEELTEGARASSAGEQRDDVIDHYVLVEEIGEGGMGTVWRARQEEPVQRDVALKVIKLGMDTRQVVARFEAERQALALMDHPSIAKVYDAGVTETGRPYFVMELVHGSPITEFCDNEGMPTVQRLALFRQVCLAVQHAHQKGILHRDLKPSNILVTMVDGVAQPKVIDFGIAKAMEKPLTDSSLATEAFQVMGTPEYMPPEQASGLDVDTRADVYSLGVVLYELLTGAPPFGRETGGLNDLGKLLRQIHDETPPKPSTRASDLGEALELIARKHGEQRGTFTRSLRGDLDWIVMKALEKDRERRYATAVELSEDIGRHLANEPVLASPPSTKYRVGKFVRRNRLTVGSATMVALTLVIATIGLGLLYSRTLISEALAIRQAETSRQALSFMIEMFEVSDPSQARGETVTAREILDRGAERIDRELADQPEIRATLAATMGEVYSGLGLYRRAAELLSLAEEIKSDLDGEEDPDVLRLSAEIAGMWANQSRLEESEELLRETLERQQRLLGTDHIDVLGSCLLLSNVLEQRSKFDEAEALARATLDTACRTLGEDHELALRALNRLGLAYKAAGRFDKAEEQLRKALELRRRIDGDNHPETLNIITNIGELYMDMGRFEEAEDLFDEGLETARLVFGDEHPNFVTYRSKLALLYRQQGRLEEAEKAYRAVIEIQRRTRGDLHLSTLVSLNTLGAILMNQGRFDEAEPYYLEALEGLRSEVGEQSEQTLTIFGNMAMFYLQTNQLEDAETWGWKTYEGSKALHGEDHPLTILRLENLANVFYAQGAYDAAVEILEQVLEGRRRGLGNEHPAITRTLVNLSVVLGNMGDLEGARAVREELLERTFDGLGFDYANVAEELASLARELFTNEEYERAAECMGEILRIRLEALGSEDPLTVGSMRDAMKVAIQLERWDEVEARGIEYYETHLRVLGAKHSNTKTFLRRMVEGYEAKGDELQAEFWRAKQQAAED